MAPVMAGRPEVRLSDRDGDDGEITAPGQVQVRSARGCLFADQSEPHCSSGLALCVSASLPHTDPTGLLLAELALTSLSFLSALPDYTVPPHSTLPSPPSSLQYNGEREEYNVWTSRTFLSSDKRRGTLCLGV